MEKGSFSPKTKKIIKICLLVFLLLFTFVLYWFVGRPMIDFVSQPNKFRDFIAQYGLWGRAAFVIMVIFQVVIAIIPGEPFELGAGYAFGFLEGTFLMTLGIVLGSAIIFALVKRFGVAVLEIFFSAEKIKSIAFLKQTNRLFFIAFFVFLIPATPKDLLSYGVGLTKIDFWKWMFLAGVARLPSIVTSVYCGKAIQEGEWLKAVICFGTTGIFSIFSLLIYRRISAKKERALNKKPNK